VRGIARTVALAGALALVAAASAAGAFSYKLQWGREGTANGQFGTGREAQLGDRQFNSPGGVVVNKKGQVLVTDTSNNRVQFFSKTGKFLKKFGRFGFDHGSSRKVESPNGFILPQGIALDGAGNIYVADNRNDRVMKFSAKGRFLKRIGLRGAEPQQMISPWGIAIHGSTLYVVDQGNYRIQRWSTT
jgi:tripartite motif-containing protein 71